MRSLILDGETMASRIRPSRRARWRRYLPPAVLAGLSILAIVAPSALADPLSGLGLGATGARVLLASVAVLGAIVAAALAGQAPVLALVSGAFATSLGGNLLSGPWIGLPLTLAGLAWIGLLETKRVFEGISISPDGLVLHRALERPLTLDYEDVRAVHTSPYGGDAGTLILETEHGTVTAPHLPRARDLKARIEARTNREPVQPTPGSIRAARDRIEAILASGDPEV